MPIRYVALGPIFSGEGSRAFLGLRVADDDDVRPCALVWAPEDVLHEPEQVESLRRETARAVELSHPNILRVYGLTEMDGGLARVVEFADGESLRRVLDVVQRLPAGVAARIVSDAAFGVHYAHLAGNDDGSPLIHGDLRPDTLFVSYAGATKVSGYGALGVAPRETGGKRIPGRRRYSAPEQILGGRYAVTPQTDVYLLGAVLYEALTGEIPFQNEKDFDWAVIVKQEPSLLQSEFVPVELRPVISKALAKKSQFRYPTVQAFREAIEQAMGTMPDRSEVGAVIDRAFAADEARLARAKELELGMAEWAARRASPPVAAAVEAPATSAPSAAESAAPEAPPAAEAAVSAPGTEAPAPAEAPAIPAEARSAEALRAEVPRPGVLEASVTASPAASELPPPDLSAPVVAGAQETAAAPVTAAAPTASAAPTPAASTAAAARPEPVAAPARAAEVPDAAPAVPAPTPRPAARPAAARFAEPVDDEPRRPRRKGTSPWMIVLPIAAVVIGIAFWSGRRSAHVPSASLATGAAPAPSDAPQARGAQDSHEPQATQEPQGSARTRPASGGLDPKAAEAAENARMAARALVGHDEAPPEPAPAPERPRGPAKPTLEVVTTPPLLVVIDGKRVGRTPIKVPVSSGTHRVTLVDPAQGIQLVRSVHAKPGANRLALRLGKGTLMVTAPAGCEIRIDGRHAGTTPLASPLTVFEGNHRIQVSQGSAKWQQAFSVADGQELTADVKFEARAAATASDE